MIRQTVSYLYMEDDLMKHTFIMIKPASSACNLRCKYCFYADLAGKRDTYSFGKMTEDTVDKILNNVRLGLEDGDRMTFAFQGGEPTLVGLEWYRRFVSKVKMWKGNYSINYALQTNGTMLDDDWCEFLAQNHFLVGISIDAMPKTHNSCRLDINGKGTYRQADEAVRLMRKHHVEFNVLCTLTSDMARHPQQVWNWICQNDFRYVQFTPCLGELGEPGESAYALQPKKFASFYSQLFQLWFADFKQGNYRSIKLFDDIVNLLAYGVPTACGIHGKCQCQLVVEADGSVYPCDFYCIDQYRLGNLTENLVEELYRSPAAKEFLLRPRNQAKMCDTCIYRNFCGGGCHRMQYEVYCAPEDTFCGYKSFLDSYMADFQKIAAQQRALRAQSR